MHDPVMRAEVVEALAVKAGGRYIDATLGDGGHARAILERAGATGRLLGLDRDAEALKRARERLTPWERQCAWAQTNFSGLDRVADDHGFDAVDGVFFDLGVRSEQLDRAERGFSFMRAGPLDMRMDRTEARTAADLVNDLPEAELADLLWRFGDERASRKIAAAIVRRRAERPFAGTTELAETVAAATGGRRGRIHPATRTFMALRMAVNDELASLEAGLTAALHRVVAGGRVVVLTYHSVEDRLVKQILGRHIGRWESLQAGGRVWRGTLPRMKRVTRKPLVPGTTELKENPRARSAKMRVVERVEHNETA